MRKRRVRLDRPPLVQDYYHPHTGIAARRAYTSGWTRFASRVVGGLGALAVAGAANLFTKVPHLRGDPRVNMPSRQIPFVGALGPRNKKSRSGSSYVTENRAAQSAGTQGADASGYVQLTRLRKTVGKPVAKRQRLMRMLSGIAQPVITRWQNLSTMDAANGKNYLNYAAAPASPGTSIYPVYLFDLTGSVNHTRTQAAGLVPFYELPAPMLRLHRARLDAGNNDGNNQFFFSPADCALGVAPDGSTSVSTWCVERKPTVKTFPLGRTFFDWVDIRLMVWGAKSKPSTVKIQLVQFPENLCPGYWGTSTSSPANLVFSATRQEDDTGNGFGTSVPSEDDCRHWNEFWLGYTDRMVTNPLNKRDCNNIGLVDSIKVLSTETIVLNPTASYEVDTRGHMKMVNIFKRMNKLIDYQWDNEINYAKGVQNADANTTGIPNTGESNPNIWDTTAWNYTSAEGPRNQPVPRKQSRVFLMITADSPVAGAASADSHCSFDYCIRRKQTVATNNTVV